MHSTTSLIKCRFFNAASGVILSKLLGFRVYHLALWKELSEVKSLEKFGQLSQGNNHVMSDRQMNANPQTLLSFAQV